MNVDRTHPPSLPSTPTGSGVDRGGPRNTVGHFMRGPVVVVAPEHSLEEARALLDKHGISSVGVVDAGGELVGVLSRTDLLRFAHTQGPGALIDFGAATIAQALTRPATTVTPATSLAEAAGRMVDRHIHRLYVVDRGRTVGVFGTRDAMNALADRRVPTAIEGYMSAPVLAIQVNETLGQALDLLRGAGVSGLAVNDGEWPVGLFTQREALEARDRTPDVPVEEVMTSALLCLQHDTPIYRAAALAAATRARRVLAVRDRHCVGLLSGLDFTRALREA